MTQLSVNINKIATLRNARGGNVPNVLQTAIDIQGFGAQGITVHPRPDERHIRYADVRELKPVVHTEFNIEGKPVDQFMELIEEVRPAQVTLVPDAEDAITSNAGWDCRKHKDYLVPIVRQLKEWGCRVSIFLDPDPGMVPYAVQTETDRIELYTEAYARDYGVNPAKALAPYVATAHKAMEAGLGINAGHDLNSHNLGYLARHLPGLLEVSIGHALISEALYLGLEKTVQLYLARLQGK